MDDDPNVLASEIRAALQGYGLQADSVEPVRVSSHFAQAFKVVVGTRIYVARLRHRMAEPMHVVFAATWARAVVAEAPVPVPLLPRGGVPMGQGRCVDVAPYVDHDDNAGGSVSPDAWLKVGYWVGCMHRLGLPLIDQAPVDLPYGNYPSRPLTQHLVDDARQRVASRLRPQLAQAEELLARTQVILAGLGKSLPQGVVHGDMHFWNVLYIRREPVAIIDLDFLQRGYLIMDLAYACIWLDAWQRERGGEWSGVLERYLAEYERGRHRRLSESERSALPHARVLVSLFFFLQNIITSAGDEAKWREDFDEAIRLAEIAARGM